MLIALLISDQDRARVRLDRLEMEMEVRRRCIMRKRFRLMRRSGARLLRCDAVWGCSHMTEHRFHLAEGAPSFFVCSRAEVWTGVKGAYVFCVRALEDRLERSPPRVVFGRSAAGCE